MENKAIARKLRLLSQLMELHDGNPFKVKSMANAAFKIDKLPYPIGEKTEAELEKIEGIGKSTAAKVAELLTTGSITEMNELLEKTPEGVVEMMRLKGIGPKKVAVIWKDLGIENLGELYYACNENRLVEAKGFGLKTQEEIRRAIEFSIASQGKFIYAQIMPLAEELIEKLRLLLPDTLISFAGEYRRRCEIISRLVIVAGADIPADALTALEKSGILLDGSSADNCFEGKLPGGLETAIICTTKNLYYRVLFEQTGDEAHVKQVDSLGGPAIAEPGDEESIYKNAALAFIAPELREGNAFINRAANGLLPELIRLEDLRGSLHNHSTWSDGINTVEEMALFCRDELHLEYLGMCDHSRSAFYAKGLTIERVAEQQEEIEKLNAKLGGFRIFKGIESDILYDGSLDYPDDVLQSFDFVVASVHSILKMDEAKATARLIKAIENPYTTILGHPTGRLLLSRSGYPIDYKKVIDACAANNVVIEVNANPLRLDLDWRWHQYALEKGAWLSINPDAHRKEGFLDMHFGVLAARKGGLAKEQCLNALPLNEIDQFFKRKKNGVLSSSTN